MPLQNLFPPRPAPASVCAAQAGSSFGSRKAWASAAPQRKSAAGRESVSLGSVIACGDLAHELSAWEKHWKVDRRAFQVFSTVKNLRLARSRRSLSWCRSACRGEAASKRLRAAMMPLIRLMISGPVGV